MKRSAIKTDLFASAHHREKIDQLGDPLHDIETHIDFSALAAEVDFLPHLVGQLTGKRTDVERLVSSLQIDSSHTSKYTGLDATVHLLMKG